MGQMFLTKYGAFIEDSDYCCEEALRQLQGIERHCGKGNGLLVHAWSENKGSVWADPVTGRAPEVWSEGLGWYALSLTETTEVFPKNHPGYESLSEQYRRLLRSLLATQDTVTGLWYQVVDKGDMPGNWHDTFGSAMFTYSIQKAVDLGIVRGEEWQEAAIRGYKGILTKAKSDAKDGHLNIYDACEGLCVQADYDAYINYPKTVNAQEAVAAFLWATEIVERHLLQKEDDHASH